MFVCLFKNVTLEIGAGRMTALVGPSGGGKSSCVSLLQGLYEPQAGDVLLDGVPLHHYEHRYLRSKVGHLHDLPLLLVLHYCPQPCALEYALRLHPIDAPTYLVHNDEIRWAVSSVSLAHWCKYRWWWL